MLITDSDIDSDDIVDHIYLEMSPFSPGSSTATLQGIGIFGNGRLEARFSVQCSPNFNGEDCNLTSMHAIIKLSKKLSLVTVHISINYLVD